MLLKLFSPPSVGQPEGPGQMTLQTHWYVVLLDLVNSLAAASGLLKTVQR